MTGSRIQVLVVDDSALVRQAISQRLAGEPGIDVATAADPLFAMQRMRSNWPDVIVLDIEMPRMDGISFLRRLMAERPTPVVICSSFVEAGSEALIQAMALGAVGFIAKPKAGLKGFFEEASRDIVAAVRGAARAKVRELDPERRGASSGLAALAAARPPDAQQSLPGRGSPAPRAEEKVIAIGTSTGGTQALEFVLTRLPATLPGIVVVQHMPEHFTRLFAHRLDGLCAIEVREARHNDRVVPGCALIAPGGRHMLLKRIGIQYSVEVVDGPPVNRHKPSVDRLFRSVACSAGSNAVGALMTGMGVDGACGLKEMRDAGALTIAQDEASCVVFGMPKEAIRRGAAERVIPLEQFPGALMSASG